MLKYIKFKQLPKNLLIFSPFLIGQQKIDFSVFFNLLIAFIFFSIITTLIYIINDYTDKDIDKINKVKNKSNFIIENNFFIYSNIFLLIIILILPLTIYFSYIIYFYIIIFYAYNFFLKKIKYLDLLCLVSFYISRQIYGSELTDIKLSFYFMSFFFTLFLFLSIHKRLIQIKVNKLPLNNKIISYSLKDVNVLQFILITVVISNIFIFLFYLLNFYELFNVRSLIFILYCFIALRLLKLNLEDKIRVDIYEFVFRDYLIIFTTIMIMLSVLFEYFT